MKNEEKIKILFIHDTYRSSGGAEIYFFNLIKHYENNKQYRVFSAGFSKKEHFQQLENICMDVLNKNN